MVRLDRVSAQGVVFWTDPDMAASGVLVAFSERSGGISRSPFATLNMAAHVGDEPDDVDENRTRFLEALGIGESRENLVTADQVHGSRISVVGSSEAGCGAFASHGQPPISETDAAITGAARVPLLMFFADCVPVVLVAPGPYIAVAHAGWRGALASLPGMTATALARQANCEPADIVAYIGAHIGACHYVTSGEIMSQFVNKFGTFARAESGGLDLGAVVTKSLIDAGVPWCNIAVLGVCTAESTDRFFSYRAEAGQTGRHAALGCIL